MSIKKTYKINVIPSFRYEINIPTGLSALFANKGEANIYLGDKWMTWDNIPLNDTSGFLRKIDQFFKFLNHSQYYTRSHLKRLDELNKSNLGKKMFEHLSGWSFEFIDCEPNSETFVIKRTEPTYSCSFELLPKYRYNTSSGKKIISEYRYRYFCNSGCGPANEDKIITATEGKDLISLMRLSFLAMIINYPKETSSEIWVFNGHYNYKENLIELCESAKLIVVF